MPTDKKISELTTITGASVVDADLVPVVDSSATETKKVTIAELRNKIMERWFTDFAELDAQTATFADGTLLHLETEKTSYSCVSSGGEITLTSSGQQVNVLRGSNGIDLRAAGDSGLEQDVVDITGASTGALAGVTAPEIVNAAWLDGAKGPVFLPPGDYTAEDILDLGASRDKLTIRGAGQFNTRVKIPDGQYLYESAYNPTHIEMSDLQFVGGKGVLHLTNDSDYTRGTYVFRDNAFLGFTEAALASESTDFGRWDIRGNFFWAAGTGSGTGSDDINGIGIALAGWADNSAIELNRIHKARYGMKFGRCASVMWVRENSFLREASMGAGDMVPIWLVPEASGGTLIGGMQLIQNRFGNENRAAGDREIIIADQNTGGSGSDFATYGHSTSASTGVVQGLIVKDNWAKGSSDNPLVTSYTPNIRDSYFGNQLTGNMPGEIEFDSGVTVNRAWQYHLSNTIDTTGWLDKVEPLTALGSFACMFKIDDGGGVYGGAPSLNIGGGSADPEWVKYIDPSANYNGSTGSPTIAATTDSLGGTQAYNITFAGDDSTFAYSHRVFWNTGLTVASGDENRLHWVEMEIASGASNSLTHLGISIREGTTNRTRWIVEVPAGYETVRFPWVPGSATSYSLNVHPVGWVTSATEQVKVGRPRVYAANSPQNYGHIRTAEAAWDGAHLVIGAYHLWVDSTGDLRIVSGAPASDTDGTVVGTQS